MQLLGIYSIIVSQKCNCFMEKAEYKVMFRVEENHFWYRGMGRISNTLLRKYLPHKTNNKILDAGCGTGGALFFLQKFGKPVGIDISPVALSYCKKRKLQNVKKCSIEELPFPDDTFDLITCFDVICQQEVKNDTRALHEFYRVLKPGGILLLRVPAYNWLRSYHDVSVHTKHRYTRSEINTLLKEAHFTLVKSSYINTLLFPLIFIKRVILHFSPPKPSDVTPLPSFLNHLFFIPLLLESLFIRFLNFPFGVSLIAVAQKKRAPPG